MIIRIDKCNKCGNNVSIVMPDLFPNITAQALERYKKISLMPASKFCKQCIEGEKNK